MNEGSDYIVKITEELNDARQFAKQNKWGQVEECIERAHRYYANAGSERQPYYSRKFSAMISEGIRAANGLIIPSNRFKDDTGSVVQVLPSVYEYAVLHSTEPIPEDSMLMIVPSAAVILTNGTLLNPKALITIELVISE